MIWSWMMLPALPSTRARKERPKHIWESCGNRHRAHRHHFYQQQEISLWPKINSLSKRYSMMKMEILCFVRLPWNTRKSTGAQGFGWFWLCRTFWQGSNEGYHWDHWTLTPTIISYNSNRALPLSTSSRAPSILYSIQSESELKKPHLISDSRYPGGFSIWLWVSPKLWENSFIRPLLVKSYWFYRT